MWLLDRKTASLGRSGVPETCELKAARLIVAQEFTTTKFASSFPQMRLTVLLTLLCLFSRASLLVIWRASTVKFLAAPIISIIKVK